MCQPGEATTSYRVSQPPPPLAAAACKGLLSSKGLHWAMMAPHLSMHIRGTLIYHVLRSICHDLCEGYM